MLLIWERSPKGRRKRKMACSHSFSLLLLFVRPGNGERSKRSFFLSRCGGERVAIRLHRPTARRAAFASNAHQGVFFFFFYSSPYSTSSRSFSLPLIPPLLLFSLPRTPPLWNILVLPSCTRVATANLTLLRLHCLVRRCICAYTHAHSYHVGRESSWSSFSISLSLSPRAALLPSLPWQVQLIFLFGIRVPPHRAQIMSRISVRYLSYAELRLRTGGREAFSSLDKDFCFWAL